jgi:large subunit ribosomal protein L24
MAGPKIKLKKGDKVVVLAGKDKGERGEILKMLRPRNKAIVQGVNMVKRHTAPSQTDPAGGIVAKEMPIHLSNLAIEDPKDGKPTRIGVRTLKDGTKERFAKRSGEAIND